MNTIMREKLLSSCSQKHNEQLYLKYWSMMMAEKSLKVLTIVIVVIVSSAIVAGTSVGIWLGVRNANNNTTNGPCDHPDCDWAFNITGKIDGGDFSITMSELLNMPQHEEDYVVKAKPPYFEGTFTGVQIGYLFDHVIDIDSSATTVTFIGEDGYAWSFSLDIGDNESNILAHSVDGEYFDSYADDGDGYLRLIMHASGVDDFNGQYCVKNVVELRFS